MVGKGISAYYLLQFKLADYESRHRGKRPARIFMSDAMLMELESSQNFKLQVTPLGGNKVFGIPVSIFWSGDPMLYFSDEEG